MSNNVEVPYGPNVKLKLDIDENKQYRQFSKKDGIEIVVEYINILLVYLFIIINSVYITVNIINNNNI